MDCAIPITQVPCVPPTPAGHSAAANTRVPPVLTAPTPVRRASRFHAGYVVLAAVICLPLLCAAGLASYFRLSSATQALRSSVMEAVPGTWDKRIAVNVGYFTVGAVRYGSQFFRLPPEPRAALRAVHGGEVGVYQLQETPTPLDYRALFAAADKSMNRRGWERLAGVAEHGQFVAVYVPHRLRSAKHMACCVAVLKDQDLVVVSARGNLEPLLGIAEQHLRAEGVLH